MKFIIDALKNYVITNVRNIAVLAIVGVTTAFFPQAVTTIVDVCGDVQTKLTQE